MIKNFLCCCWYWYKDAKYGGSYGQISVDGAFISVNGRETRLATEAAMRRWGVRQE